MGVVAQHLAAALGATRPATRGHDFTPKWVFVVTVESPGRVSETGGGDAGPGSVGGRFGGGAGGNTGCGVGDAGPGRGGGGGRDGVGPCGSIGRKEGKKDGRNKGRKEESTSMKKQKRSVSKH